MRTDTGNATDRAVSPVVGVVLMTGIVVVLAAVVASMALGFESELGAPTPYGGFDTDYAIDGAGNTNDRPYVNITHAVGRPVPADDVLVKDESGNTVRWSAVWTGGSEVYAGEYVHIDGFGSDGALDPICTAGQTYYIVVQSDDGKTQSVTTWEVPSDPDLPAGSPSDSDGDGVPDWC
jgi:flagellin-like protein